MQISKDLTDATHAGESIAVAIKSNRPERRHTGIFYKSDDEPWKLIHLGWHGDFEITEETCGYCVSRLDKINPVLLDGFADWLSQLLIVNDGFMAYSIKPFDQEPFDNDGKVKFSQPGDGFTCATFVLWAFYRWSIPLISLDGWQDRAEDKVWRKWIVDMLVDHQTRCNIPHEHIIAQMPYVEHAARFRPEEVAGAAGEWVNGPFNFNEAIAYGELVLSEMRKIGMLK